MSKTFSLDFKGNQGFDCSAFLPRVLEWPVNEGPNQLDGFIASSNDRDVSKYYNHYNEQPGTSPFFVRNRELLQNGTKAVSHESIAEKFLEEQYYAREYNKLIAWMDEEVIVPPPSQFTDNRVEIQRMSLLADETLRREFSSTDSSLYDRCSSSCEDLAKEVAIKAIESPREVMSFGGFQSFVEEQLIGFGASPENADSSKNGASLEKTRDDVLRKRRVCRYFVKGFCQFDDKCEFLHDPSIFCSVEQKVFLGGLLPYVTPRILKTKLEEQGLTVLNKPRIKHGFCPEVCLGSVEEANDLIARRYVYIGEQRVDVRPYWDRDQLRQVFPSVVKRSVFLGGLAENTTAEIIITDLQRLGIQVENFPVVKNGYAPCVILGSVENAKMLVALKRVIVNGTVVGVRPYVSMRKRY